jgi:hypothetical protein
LSVPTVSLPGVIVARSAGVQARAAVGAAEPAAEAALTAYSVILTEAVTGSAGDPAATAAIESSLTRHVADLELMVASVPPMGQGAVRHALASSTVVLNDLDDVIVQGAHDSEGRPVDDVLAPTDPTATKPAPPAKGPGAAAGAAPAAAPDATPKPAKTATPYTSGHANGNGGTPPGHAEPKGAGNTDPPTHPTDKSTGPKSGGS